MLSTDQTPQGLSCLSNSSTLRTEPVVIGETTTPSFSIRDYVFKSRSKDIATNWPFPQEFLELCLKHGIKYLLPPFETPKLVEGWSCRKTDEAKLAISCSVAEEISSQFETLDIKDGPVDAELHPLLSEKKSRSLLKLSSIIETSRIEDTGPSFRTVSDPMASKVCPVCKTFASSSNTTLNAHIDQCLSTDSNLKCVEPEIPKSKVKPTKRRLMVDIYATAPRSTLEDLDKRNGTSWALELALMAPTSAACTEIKRPKHSLVDTRDDENGGAVYVDSNGIKLRILSKSNDTPPVKPKEDFKLNKHAKTMKAGNSSLISKKKSCMSKYPKYMKVKPHIKKLSSFKSFKGEVQAASGGDYHAETHVEKEESPSKISNATDQIKSCGSTTLRHWVSSKRSDLPRKLKHKDINFSGSNRPDIGISSVTKSHTLKFSEPLEDSTSSPKTKKVDFLSNNAENGKNTKTHVFNTKWSSKSISRSLRPPNSSLRSRREETLMSTTEKSDNSCNMTMSLETKKSLSAKKTAMFGRRSSWERSKGDTSTKFSTTRRFRKHVSIVETRNQGDQLPCGPDATRPTSRSDLSEGIPGSGSDEIVDDGSPRSSNISEFEEGEEASAMENQPYNTLKWLHPGQECHGSELENSDIQAEILACGDIITKSSMGEAEVDPTSSAKVGSWPSMDGNGQVGQGGEDTCAAQCREWQAKSLSVQEYSACLTCYEDMVPEIPQQNSSITSIKTNGQDHNLAMEREPRRSPLSTDSTISPSPQGSEVKDSVAEPLMRNLYGTKGRTAEKINHDVNTMDGRNSPARGKKFPNLYIAERASSPFNSYSGLRVSDSRANSDLDSPTESITTKVSTNFSSPSPRTHTQSTCSTSILRLMGKNLMVAKNEDSAQLLMVHPALDDPSNTKRNRDFFSHYQHLLHGGSSSAVAYQMPLHSPNSILHSACLERADMNPQFPVESVSSSPDNMMKEVIVIDESPEFEAGLRCRVPSPIGVPRPLPCPSRMKQRPFSCFRPENQFFSRDVTSGFRPYPPNACPMPEGLDPFMPRLVGFQSPHSGHPNPSLYYSQTHR